MSQGQGKAEGPEASTSSAARHAWTAFDRHARAATDPSEGPCAKHPPSSKPQLAGLQRGDGEHEVLRRTQHVPPSPVPTPRPKRPRISTRCQGARVNVADLLMPVSCFLKPDRDARSTMCEAVRPLNVLRRIIQIV